MRHLYLLLLFPIFIAACSNPNKTPLPGLSKDMYFVETKDTVSPQGPSTITRNILQDKKGNFWFATWQGIMQYNGKVFTNYTLKENLKHYHVFSLLETHNGDLWFGMIGGGVYHFDGKAFTNFTTEDGLPSNSVTCMLEDKAGKLWFGTMNGLSCFDPAAGEGEARFTNYEMQNCLGHNSLNTLLQDKTGKIWVGTDEGVNWYNPLAGLTADLAPSSRVAKANGEGWFTDFENTEGPPFHNVRSIIEDKSGNIWIGSEGGGLTRYDGKIMTQVYAFFASYIFEDKSGSMWLSVGRGANEEPEPWMRISPIYGHSSSSSMVLCHYDPTGKQISLKATPGVLEAVYSETSQVFGICQDNTGRIWFGTSDGVCCFDPSLPESLGQTGFTNFRE